MSALLDLDDVVADNPLAKTELAELRANLASVKAELEKCHKSADDEVEQFNAGCQAFTDGIPIENEPDFDDDYDVWCVGWVWQKYCSKLAAHPQPPSDQEAV